MRIGFVGGGTGGHFYPLMAVAESLRKSEHKPDLYYFGPAPYDKKALEENAIQFVGVPAGKVRRYFSIRNFFDPFLIFVGIFVAIVKLYKIYPDVIFSKGGYTSVPLLIAARLLMIPVVIHESDAVPGKANKLAAGQARYIGIAYDDVAKYFAQSRTALVGIPLRTNFRVLSSDPFAELGIPNDGKPLIFVTGGSSGATRLNDLILSSVERLLPHYRIFHQTGLQSNTEFGLAVQGLLGESSLLNDYYVYDFLDAHTLSNVMSAASLVITRAGSTTLFSIAYIGKPSIVIPIPEDISRDQRSNAYAYGRTGAAVVIEEKNLTVGLLEQEIQSILSDPTKQQQMSAAAREVYVDGAEEKIANILLSIGIEHGS
jgi:UDP-N-acetylglucosamine--N-acetylmuramyl-(pentapeptide) pyrophosphoryl-undecaprenol N-acetylglucosamine transferase